MKVIRSMMLSAAVTVTASISLPSALAAETQFEFEARNGEKTTAYKGTFTVPENRAKPNSRMIELHYVRFPATTDKKGSPIIYLSGGPGGSGIETAKNFRYPLFQAMRAYGDVIALDQRGTGASNDLPICVSPFQHDEKNGETDEEFIAIEQNALRECLAFWKEKDIDLVGYNTRENAHDLDALRQTLGAEKISLWGISYGSHLALASLNEIEEHLDRIIIASAEGLEQTVKYPARTDAYFDRLQEAINTQEDAKAIFPDVKKLIRRVHDRLDQQPLLLELPQRDGSTEELLFQRHHMQRISSFMIADPNRFAKQLVQIYAALDQGETAPLVFLLQRFYRPNAKVTFSPMAVMTDIASGMSQNRKKEISRQAKKSLLSYYLNDTYYLHEVAKEYDLGETFRTSPKSDVPLLLLSGTLDGRTYIESQIEAVASLSNVQYVTVTNAGHNLFMASPEVGETMGAFLDGKNMDGREITIPLPKFAEFPQ